MDHDTKKGKNPFGERAAIERRPLRARIFIGVILLVIVCIGFYFTTLITIAHYENL